MNFEVLLGPNTNQWWIYDNDTDEYIDPPAKILDKAAQYSDINKQEEYLVEVINKNPQWLYDKDYRYGDIEI